MIRLVHSLSHFPGRRSTLQGYSRSRFTIVPSVLLILVATVRVPYLSKGPRRVARSPLAIGKLVSVISVYQRGLYIDWFYLSYLLQLSPFYKLLI